MIHTTPHLVDIQVKIHDLPEVAGHGGPFRRLAKLRLMNGVP